MRGPSISPGSRWPSLPSELDVGPLPETAVIEAMLDVDAREWSELVYPDPPGLESEIA